MDNLKIFEKEEFGSVRISIDEKNEPWFCLTDVCKILSIKNVPDTKQRLDIQDCCSLKLQRENQEVNRGNREATFINESALYETIIRSDKPEAKLFRKWITKEVLPSIRKTGGYIVSKPEDTNEEILARAFLVAMDTIKRKDEEIKQLNVKTTQLTEKTIKDAPKVEFFNQVTDSKDAIDMASCAKVLHLGIGRNSLFQILRNEGILTSNNQPYQQYIDRGWFRVIEQKFEKENGDICVYLKTVVYQKGVDGIRRILTDQNIIEK